MNVGHARLLDDLRELLREAEAFEFHDHKNTRYAAPKAQLHAKLTGMAVNVRKGVYDDDDDDTELERKTRR